VLPPAPKVELERPQVHLARATLGRRVGSLHSVQQGAARAAAAVLGGPERVRARVVLIVEQQQQQQKQR
jgi:hypothetical protein